MLSQGAFNGQLMNPKETCSIKKKKNQKNEWRINEYNIPRTYYSSQTTFLTNQRLKSGKTHLLWHGCQIFSHRWCFAQCSWREYLQLKSGGHPVIPASGYNKNTIIQLLVINWLFSQTPASFDKLQLNELVNSGLLTYLEYFPIHELLSPE